MGPFHVADRIKAFDARELFRFSDTCIGEIDRMVFFVDDKMFFPFQSPSDTVSILVFA